MKNINSHLTLIFSVALLTSPNVSECATNLKDASFTASWSELQVVRVYNSRSLQNGLFGFGWCSNLETSLRLNPGQGIQVRECEGDEVEFSPLGTSNTYVSKARPLDRINQFAKHFVRIKPDGSAQKFDLAGRLISVSTRDGAETTLSRGPDGKLRELRAADGDAIQVTYDPLGRKIAKLKSRTLGEATYRYSGDDLIVARDEKARTIRYGYDELHNLIRIEHPDKTTELLTYDKDKDWVTSFKDRDGCLETYEIQPLPDNPRHHFLTKTAKTCAGRLTSESTHEFLHKLNSDGLAYLARLVIKSGRSKTEITYHPQSGQPTRITRDTRSIYVAYDDLGRIVSINEKGKPLLRFDYGSQLDRPSRIESPGVGVLEVAYDKTGAIREISSQGGKQMTSKLIQAMSDSLSSISPTRTTASL